MGLRIAVAMFESFLVARLSITWWNHWVYFKCEQNIPSSFPNRHIALKFKSELGCHVLLGLFNIWRAKPRKSKNAFPCSSLTSFHSYLIINKQTMNKGKNIIKRSYQRKWPKCFPLKPTNYFLTAIELRFFKMSVVDLIDKHWCVERIGKEAPTWTLDAKFHET